MAGAEQHGEGHESDEGQRIIGDGQRRSDLEAGLGESEDEEVASAREPARGNGAKGPDKTCPPSTSDGNTEADCRICLLSDKLGNLITPCACDGTLKYCHYKCLKHWVKESRSLSCEICGQAYLEPFRTKLANTVARAEKLEQERRDAALAAQLTGVGASDNMLPADNRPAGRLWCRVILLILVTVGLLYIVLFLSKGSHFSFWTVMLLRVLSFVVPFYLIGRGIMALQKYRQERGLIVDQ
ncbi:unnamed protein product [Ostreobium quekettii]|uniref:RING-CH-type domain-containing protein n=1 Tax=Ostreobium quekettii TaxID=121088 RepID=A0A8S1J097_9CHLO|nr:unnamed protein product [Ostreobium quekettii]|eukprot:evm.model.scf_437EXC.14 EVM.evm.TU.scf_437EXC.14   scf_437EXC:75498-79500(+)